MTKSREDRTPSIDPDAWVAPDATVCGNVEIGAGSRVLPGARIVAQGGGTIRIGRFCIVMENAVIRATARHSCTIGDHCLFGPHSHVVGARIEDEVFVATGASVFHGAVVGRGAEVRVNGTVHLIRFPRDQFSVWVSLGVVGHQWKLVRERITSVCSPKA